MTLLREYFWNRETAKQKSAISNYVAMGNHIISYSDANIFSIKHVKMNVKPWRKKGMGAKTLHRMEDNSYSVMFTIQKSDQLLGRNLFVSEIDTQKVNIIRSDGHSEKKFDDIRCETKYYSE